VNIGRAVRAGRWNEEKRTVQDRTRQKSHKRVIFHQFGEKPPLKQSTLKNCLVGDDLDVIMHAKFQNENFRGYDFTGD